MLEGPLFAAQDDDHGPVGDGDDYAYDDDSDYTDEDGGRSEDYGDTDDSSYHEKSVSDAVASSKSEFDDSDTSSVIVCRPGKKVKKKAKKICSAATVKKNLETCDGGTNAWADAKKTAGKEPTVQVKKTESGFGAETSGSTVTIAPTSNCCDATESLLFELHNVESQKRFEEIDSDAAKGLYSREGYARDEEHVEYDGLKRSWETFDKCKKKWGCGTGAKSFADVFRKARNFNDYYRKYLAKKHKDNYRKFWDKNYKAAYLATKKGP